jgi:nucleotide-binding universal stress UspA family protein
MPPRSRGRLSILYVNDPLLIAAAGIALHDRTLARRTLAELLRFVQPTVSPDVVEPGRVLCAVASGRPADEITKAATRRRCDLIVMGTHGLTGADKLFIGSTTRGVFQRSTVPVLAIPGAPAGRRRRRANGRSWPGDRIVVPVTLDRSAMHDARAAARVARWLGSGVLLVHVLPEAKSSRWLQKRAGVSDRIRIAQAQARLAALGVGVLRDAAVQTRVLIGETTREIARVAATERAGLVITTLRKSRDWSGPRRGSISYDVLTQVTTPCSPFPVDRGSMKRRRLAGLVVAAARAIRGRMNAHHSRTAACFEDVTQTVEGALLKFLSARRRLSRLWNTMSTVHTARRLWKRPNCGQTGTNETCPHLRFLAQTPDPESALHQSRVDSAAQLRVSVQDHEGHRARSRSGRMDT